MTLLHSDYCTHLKNDEDKDILTRRLFDVNFRLMKTSESYYELVRFACEYIAWCASTDKQGYKKPHGFSGANAGIPFNIIAVMVKGDPVVMINPKITAKYGEPVRSKSNCGSLTLDKQIDIYRHEFIDVEFYDLEGKKTTWTKVPSKPGFTIQHEIDHNLGILITDRTWYQL